MFFRGFCLLSAVCLLVANAVFAQEIQVLKISAEDERATVKTADGKIKMIKVGEIIKSCEFRVTGSELKDQNKLGVTSSGLRVTEISEGRIVLEENTERGIETVIIRVEDDKSSGLRVTGSGVKNQKIERIRKSPDERPVYMTK